MILRKYPIHREYQDVFLDELPEMPLVREFDLSIELIPRDEPVSRIPYRMTTIKM